MDFQYVAPLERAWVRMKGILFDPFDLGKWFVLGFSAWLARLAGGGGGGGFNLNLKGGHEQALSVRRFLRGAWEHVRAHPHWLAIVVAGAVVAAVIALVLVWISSRGKFIFLDNVVHDRARIAEPWRRFAPLADSLFLWRLGYVIVCLCAFAAVATLAVVAAGGFHGFGFGSARAITITLMAALVCVVGAIACAYVSLFLDSFIVPVMYREGVGAVEAWRRFVPTIERHFGAFVLYGMFVLALVVMVGVGIVAVGLMTCCIGLLLVALPYFGTVILLPLIVTYRAFSLEFLTQLGPGFAILAEKATVPAPNPAPTA